MRVTTELGYRNVPEGLRGWDGHWGAVPVQGPAPRPTGWVERPSPEEVVEAEVTTRWNCHACGKENDVEGEGAVYTWMDCGYCSASSYLVI